MSRKKKHNYYNNLSNINFLTLVSASNFLELEKAFDEKNLYFFFILII